VGADASGVLASSAERAAWSAPSPDARPRSQLRASPTSRQAPAPRRPRRLCVPTRARLSDADAAAAYREMIQRPPEISDADWSYFMEARGTRLRQLDRQLREIEPYPRGLPDDPGSSVAAHLGASPAAGCACTLARRSRLDCTAGLFGEVIHPQLGTSSSKTVCAARFHEMGLE
jgi:hypothetical protein